MRKGIGMQQFFEALHDNSIEKMQCIPKSDLHNHAGRGGNIHYIEEWKHIKILPPSKPFDSIDEMDNWFEKNVKVHCPGMEGYLKRIEDSFAQAAKENIKLLAMSYGIGEVQFFDNVENFIIVMDELHKNFSRDIEFYPELSLNRASDSKISLDKLDEIFSSNWFKSIDICGDENAIPIENYKSIFRYAKRHGLRLKSHVGEFGTAEDVKKAVEELELDEVHHGIAASSSPQVMKWLADNKIQLNVCPSSNIMLKRSLGYGNHQIRELFDYGVIVTINTDDLLIFNSSISQEYLNLFNAKLMTAEELNIIRENGLKIHYNNK